ncbi:MAG: hypothetical protein WDW38_004410 [Sanguina aurantia]
MQGRPGCAVDAGSAYLMSSVLLFCQREVGEGPLSLVLLLFWAVVEVEAREPSGFHADYHESEVLYYPAVLCCPGAL